MKLTSVIKAPEGSITIGLAEAAAVYVIYQSALPNHADIRAADPHNTDVESSRRAAAWKAASILGLVFLITQDLNSFLIGGAALAGIDYMVKHANGVHPATGKLAGPNEQSPPADNDVAFPVPDYADQQADQFAGMY
jgi:hypothetical protein